MTLAELQDLVDFMKENGLRRLRTEDVEVELSDVELIRREYGAKEEPSTDDIPLSGNLEKRVSYYEDEATFAGPVPQVLRKRHG